MLTGRLPFLGESPISVALKHLQEDVEEPRKVNPLIPQSVENVILKAMRKKPEERYQSAHEMLTDLETCLLPERRNEPKVSFDDDDGIDDESTRVIPAIRPNQLNVPERPEPSEVRTEWRDDTRDAKRKKRGWIKPTVWLVVLLLILGGMWMAVGWVKNVFTVPDVTVPNVVGKNVVQAKEQLRSVPLDADVSEVPSDTVPKDQVISQDPEANIKTKSKTVKLVVSSGPAKQKMPGLTGMNIRDARDRLSGMGLNPDTQIEIDQQFSDSAAADTVIQQFPGVDESIDPKTATVKLTVSKGKESFKMPNLVGMTLSDAKQAIQDNRLKLAPEDIGYDTSYTVPKDKVISQFPFKAGDDVTPNSSIKLLVSKGLPDDAGTVTVTVTLVPTSDGKESTFNITVSDATGDNIDYKTVKTSTKQNVDVKVTVAPNKPATIQTKENNTLVNVQTVTYQDYLARKAGGGTQQGTTGTGGKTGTTPGSGGTNGGTAGQATPAAGTVSKTSSGGQT
jgi:serine/threonine-protein kinase